MKILWRSDEDKITFKEIENYWPFAPKKCIDLGGKINIPAGVILIFRSVFTFRKDEGSCFTSSLMNISQSPYEEHRVKTICDLEELYFNEDNFGVIAAGE